MIKLLVAGALLMQLEQRQRRATGRMFGECGFVKAYPSLVSASQSTD